MACLNKTFAAFTWMMTISSCRSGGELHIDVGADLKDHGGVQYNNQPQRQRLVVAMKKMIDVKMMPKHENI